MKLYDIVLKDVHKVVENSNTSGGPGLISNVISNDSSEYDLVHVCCLVPHRLSQAIEQALHERASAIIKREFGKAAISSHEVGTPDGKTTLVNDTKLDS